MNALPRFKGWTVDKRLKEFRKVFYGAAISKTDPQMVVVPFTSEIGEELLTEYIQVTSDTEGLSF